MSSNYHTIFSSLSFLIKATVRIFLQPTEGTEAEQDAYLGEYTFFLAVNSSNPEMGDNVADNQMYIHIPLSVTSDWKVTGTSKPATLEYNITEMLPDKYLVEDQLGPEVVHIYDIKNKGPATIKEAEVYIMWPSFTKDDQRHLLYLLGVSYDSPEKVTCQPIRNINPLYIKTIESKGYAEALLQAQENDAQLGLRRQYHSASSSSSSTSWSSGSGSGSSTSWSSGGGSRTSSSSRSSSSSSSSRNSYQGSKYDVEAEEDDLLPTRGGEYTVASTNGLGAEETRLTDAEIVKSESAAIKTASTASTYNAGARVNSGNTLTGSLGGTSGWRLLDNGTYIRIYDSRWVST